MCGICGKYYYQTEKQVENTLLNSMTSALYTRGPDEQRIFVHCNVGLGVRRLRIIDVQNGSQPMCNENGTIIVVVNGEIYNYLQLKADLIDAGHVFKAHCDSEILAHLYEERGESFLQALEGMFAIALLDLRNNSLLLARDRIGIKPLYFCKTADAVIFSSSASSLLLDPDVNATFDYRAINCYFTYNYFPEDYTPFSGIKKLLPGFYLLCKRGSVSIERYWKLRYYTRKIQPEYCAAHNFEELFENAIKKHLISDVPVGVFLSGGIDSSAVTYYASKFNRGLDTFSIGFKESTFDERFYAAKVAKLLGARHHETVIDDNVSAMIDKLVCSLDIPIGEASFLPTLLLSEFAKQYVGMVLSGEGADELFGGYETYKADQLVDYARVPPALLRRKLLPLLLKGVRPSDSCMDFRLKADLFLKGINSSLIPHYSWREIFSEDEKGLLYSKGFLSALSESGYLNEPYEIFRRTFYQCDSTVNLERAMYCDAKIWLPDSILYRLDTASMFYSLEARVPYLDNTLIEFAYSLPLKNKIARMRTKCILRSAFKHCLPREIINRPKHGFSVPISAWLRSELKDFCGQLFNHLPQEARFFINQDVAVTLFRQHTDRIKDNSRQLWNLMIFILWLGCLKERLKNIRL